MLDNAIRVFACISLIIGAVGCFAGFKMAKSVLAIPGFLIGAVIGVVAGASIDNTVLGLIVGIGLIVILGTALAVLFHKFYYGGIYILTTFLIAVLLCIAEVNIWIALSISIVFGALSLYFVKPVVILATAASGASIILWSAFWVMDPSGGSSDSAVAIVIISILWAVIMLAGVAVQFVTTLKIKGAPDEKPKKSARKKYPGMQRAYKNFCIKCGCERPNEKTKYCPGCGYRYEN